MRILAAATAIILAATTAACTAADAFDGQCTGTTALAQSELAHVDETIANGGEHVVLTVAEDGDDGHAHDHGEAAQALLADDGLPAKIFLNRAGGVYTAGKSDSSTNTTSLVSDGCAAIPAFPHDDAVWRELVSCVQDRFARFDVEVTDEEPRSGAYVEAAIGGHPADLGLPEVVAGIAPMDVSSCRVLPAAVVFVFAGRLPADGQLLCEVAAQEVAHAYGLDHQYLCEDPMSYLRGCGAKEFQNVDAACGEHEPRDCMCGRTFQNSVQLLEDVLGAKDGVSIPTPTRDADAPVVTVLEPADGGRAGVDGMVKVVARATDDVSVSEVTLQWHETNDELPCPLRSSGATCERDGDTYTWRLAVGHGSRSFTVEAIDHTGKSTTTPTVSFDLAPEGSATARF